MNNPYLLAFWCFLSLISTTIQGQNSLAAVTAQKIERLIILKEQELQQLQDHIKELAQARQELTKQEYLAKQKGDKKRSNEIKTEISANQKKQSKVEESAVQVKKNLEELLKINRASLSYQQKWLNKYEQKNGPINPVTLSIQPTPAAPAKVSTVGEQTLTPASYTLFSELYNSSNSPKKPCKVVSETNNKITKITASGVTVFKYTPPALSSYYKDRSYIEAEALFGTHPGYRYMTLLVTVHSDRARQSFGQWSQGSALTLYLINGEVIILSNTLNDGGNIDYQQKATVYTGNFVISSKQENILAEIPVERIRVVWSTGFEEYEVYEMDFLMRLIGCIHKY